jgi:hypothetical protein
VKFGTCLAKKTHFFALGKWKMSFLCNENENSLHQHCLSFQVECDCRILDHLNILCYDCGHLAWKSWIFVRDSSFLNRLFSKNCNIQCFLFFLVNRSHEMSQCEGFLFFIFLNFLCWFQNAMKTVGVTVLS